MRKSLLLLVWALSLPVGAQESHNFEVMKNLDIFNSLYRELDLYYVDTLDAKKNVDNALRYMLDQLDPYTEYYAEDKTADLKQMTTGKYAGIGSPILYRKREKRCIFSNPYEGMPAARAGIRTGDVILAIDGRDLGTAEPADGADYAAKVSEQLRGEPGTTFELRVQRPGVSKPLVFKLTRQTVELPSVPFHTLLPAGIGYVLLNGYTENTARDLRLAVAQLKTQGARRLILDLRGNPGGLMEQAIKVVNFFVPKGKEVVHTRGKVKEMNATFRTTDEPLDLTIPLVVLVDYNTASAAEITSGALQDYDRAVVVGRRTYGKGLVQQPRPLPYDTYLKLTTSKYFIPSGRCIQALDYKNRNENGEPKHLPDSLSKVYHTAAGRPVRDGGGITPDVAVELDSLPGLITYLSFSDVLTDYVVDYRNRHATIAAPAEFRLTDAEVEAFKAMVKAGDFSYDAQSKRVLNLLRDVARREGYAAVAESEFKALEAKLAPDLDRDFDRWKDYVREMLETEIVRAYYYDKGVAEYSLRNDRDLTAAVAVLNDAARYAALLAPQSAAGKGVAAPARRAR